METSGARGQETAEKKKCRALVQDVSGTIASPLVQDFPNEWVSTPRR